ncbi:RNA-binding (RRM/RBD/RNP motifs) family protein [Actinidia rufa]|uniref:RNA-binding (RRM/RBD/RNP motifs) family protein n=1 Tax=Actinidia rufa TaxID=165716 RepID=A0A7J0EE24_9ERIC|nr:RNA-binding (RRM/RBD/RNP motifs) family protein [Actinidia rufa]
MPPRTAKKSLLDRRRSRSRGPRVGPPRRIISLTRLKQSAKVKEIKVEEVKIEEVKIESQPAVSQVVELDPEREPEAELETKLAADGLCFCKKGLLLDWLDVLVLLCMGEEDDVKESVDEYEKGERLDLEDNEPEFEPEEYEDEMEDVPEVLEGEDDVEHAIEEHVDLVDAEEEEHHDVFKERRKRKEFEVFVGGLDKDATEDDLRKVFSGVGEVTEIRLMINNQTKKNKGFAFLRFATIEQEKRALCRVEKPNAAVLKMLLLGLCVSV